MRSLQGCWGGRNASVRCLCTSLWSVRVILLLEHFALNRYLCRFAFIDQPLRPCPLIRAIYVCVMFVLSGSHRVTKVLFAAFPSHRAMRTLVSIVVPVLALRVGWVTAATFNDIVGSGSQEQWNCAACNGATCVVGGRSSGLAKSRVDPTIAMASSAGSAECLVVTYDTANGVPTRLLSYGTTGIDDVLGIVMDASGNFYPSGYTGAALFGTTFRGGQDAFAAKFAGE